MNIKKSSVLGFLAVTTLWASGAVAAPAVNVGSNSVTAGTPTAAISVNWDGDGTVQSAQFRITYDSTQLTPVNVAASCTAPWFCSNNNAGIIQFVADQGSALPDVLIANITFNTATAAINNYPLAVTNQLFANSVPASVPPSGTTNGQLSVTAGPQPAFASNPTPAAGVTVPSVIQNATDTTANVVISNSGGATSTLTGSCSLSSNPNSIFSLSGDTNFSVLQGTTDTVTVTCDSSGPLNPNHTGQMTCTHNGTSGLTSPQVYALSCAITAGPQPAYSSSNPTAGGSISLPDTEAGDPNPSQSLVITNTGAGGTTLTGSCAMAGGSDSQITVNTTATFNVAQGSAGTTRIVSCDASVEGNYTGTLSCSHNGSSPASPVDYPVSCNVTEAGAAVFRSVPVPGPIVIGDDVVVGDTDPIRTLTFYNDADPGDQLLDLSCSLSGDPQITGIPSNNFDGFLTPQLNVGVSFSCDTTISGAFTATYSCNYQNGGLTVPAGETPPPPAPNAVYQVSCDVRAAEAQVEITPAPNTPQNESVLMGGSTSFEFDFTEINDEGENGSLVGCELDSGAEGFSISSPSFPADILSGNTATVVVDFIDPTGAESWSDTLICMFGDSDDDDTQVSWPLTVTIGGGDARFTVLKDFTDDNPGEVTVDLDCDTGLILDQEKTITEDGIGVTFVVTDFDSGELNCNVTERPVAGYSGDYDSSGDSNNSSTDDPETDAGCYYTTVNGGDENLCVITNSPLPVDVVITKEWLYPGSVDASVVSDYFALEMQCYNAVIEGGYECGDFIAADGASSESYPDSYTCKNLSGYGDKVFTVEVTPSVYPGGSCYVLETSTDSAVEVDNGCAGVGQGLYSLEVSAGSGDSCTITNTVFFEGIPSLNQYGKVLMALLMLGMGFIAVRRVI